MQELGEGSLPENTADLNLTHNYKSPFMQNRVGREIVTVRYGSRRWDYDFRNNTVREITQ